ncbi:hypothetical protein GTQ40_10225 [Flavobacteriaceae bacterium R38]|nr:hypothetical protein [Flavobacteriaceae bacterium R38]
MKINNFINDLFFKEVNYINADFYFFIPKDKDEKWYSMECTGRALLNTEKIDVIRDKIGLKYPLIA